MISHKYAQRLVSKGVPESVKLIIINYHNNQLISKSYSLLYVLKLVSCTVALYTTNFDGTTMLLNHRSSSCPSVLEARSHSPAVSPSLFLGRKLIRRCTVIFLSYSSLPFSCQQVQLPLIPRPKTTQIITLFLSVLTTSGIFHMMWNLSPPTRKPVRVRNSLSYRIK